MALQISDLEFDTIKGNLKDYLRTQSEFTDYDFEGSAFNILLDTLAYTTHYLGFYANMSLSEMFLETAQLRNSIVSRAKELNYFPRQITAPRATIHLSITPTDSPTSVKVPEGTIFTVSSGTKGIVSFITTQDEFLSDPNSTGTYQGTLSITEGILVEEQFTYNGTNPGLVYKLSNSDADATTLKVTADDISWQAEDEVTILNKDSTSFFLSEEADGKIGVFFGDGVVAGAPDANAVLKFKYIITKGEEGNGLKDFKIKNPISGYAINEFTLTLVDQSSGGAPRESNESIKLIAPKNHKIQGRAVTADDYKTILLNKYGNISAIATWGGEDNIPVQYGSVFISIKPKIGKILTQSDRSRILNQILKPYNIVTISPIIVDADYLYMNITSDITYDPSQTSLSAGNIQSIIVDTITNHFASTLANFDTTFRNSNMLSLIDSADGSIVSNIISYNIAREIKGSTTENSYFFSYGNQIVESSLLSEVWTTTGALSYQLKPGVVTPTTILIDGIDTVQQVGIVELWVDGVYRKDVGSINYNSGECSLIGLNLDTLASVKIFADPVFTDITSTRNSIITLNTLTVNVDAK